MHDSILGQKLGSCGATLPPERLFGGLRDQFFIEILLFKEILLICHGNWVSQHLFDQRTEDWILFVLQYLIQYYAPGLVSHLVKVKIVHHLPAVFFVDIERQENF